MRSSLTKRKNRWENELMRGDHDSATGEESGDDELAQSMSQWKLADTVNVSGVKQATRSQMQSSENELRQGATQSQRCTTNTSACLLYTSPSPRDTNPSRMPSSA